MKSTYAYVIGLLALAFSQIILPVAYAQDEPKLVAGTLTCKGSGSVGLILGSKQSLSCSFQPGGNKPAQAYVGSITNIGLDIGIKAASVIIWTVLASTDQLPSDALVGKYAGVAADASLGLGAGAKVLVGGSKNSVTLQPLSVQGQTGVNVAVGVSGLQLRLP